MSVEERWIVNKQQYWRHCEEDVKIAGTKYDKRVKYDDDFKATIKELYRNKTSINEISRLMGCSKRFVHFTLFPERLVNARRNRDWTKYHNREQLTRLTRELRQRKKLLIKKGLAIPVKKVVQVN